MKQKLKTTIKNVKLFFTSIPNGGASNKATGKIRKEEWKRIGNNRYLSPAGFIYTKGIAGWFCVNPS